MVTKQQKKGRGRRKEPEVDLTDIGKAGEHFIVGATEFVLGTGFAIKGVKGLLEKEEGRKFVCELPFKAVDMGFEIVRKVGEQMKERRKEGAQKGAGTTRSRKINVE